jgi:hypothetical protein
MPRSQSSGSRRYLTVIQDERGYPGPDDPKDMAPPVGPKPPEIVQVITVNDHEMERQRAFYRGWTQAMELIAGQGDAAAEMAQEALRPCQHNAATGGVCDWCGERVE